MPKFTKIERAVIAAEKFNPSNTDDAGAARHAYRYGWLDGHAAGTRDSQRRMARKFKQGLRLGFTQ